MQEHDIYRAIGNLEGITKQGFKDITNRLDTLNGTVKQHSDDIKDNKGRIDIMTGKATMLGIMLGVLGSLVISFLKFFKK